MTYVIIIKGLTKSGSDWVELGRTKAHTISEKEVLTSVQDLYEMTIDVLKSRVENKPEFLTIGDTLFDPINFAALKIFHIELDDHTI